MSGKGMGDEVISEATASCESKAAPQKALAAASARFAAVVRRASVAGTLNTGACFRRARSKWIGINTSAGRPLKPARRNRHMIDAHTLSSVENAVRRDLTPPPRLAADAGDPLSRSGP